MATPAKKTTTKKTTTKKPTRKSTNKATPRMCAAAARAEGEARTKRMLAAMAEAEAAKAASRQPDASTSATTRPAGKPKKTSRPPGAPKPERAPSGLDLAAKVLAEAGEPLSAKAIADRVIAAGWQTAGKTPHATLYAAIVREIARKGDKARFRKHERGLFVACKRA